MPKSNEISNHGVPNTPDAKGYRHFGDGIAGRIYASRLQAYSTAAAGYVDVLADASGILQTSAGASGATILYASIDCSSSGDNTIVGADATHKITVVSYLLVVTSAVSVRWKSGAGTNKSGAVPIAANGGVAIAGSAQSPLLETAVNAALVLNLSGATQVSGHLSYTLV